MVDVVRIGMTDVFLEDFEMGQGKITISDWDKGAFTYYWSSMGMNIRSFLKKTNGDYFARKLCKEKSVYDADLTVKYVRKAFRENFKRELPWYTYPTAQKELREKINELKDCYSADDFINRMSRLVDDLMCYELSYEEERNFKDKLGDFFSCEPWGFIETRPSDEYNYLVKLHEKIKKVV